MGRLRKVLNTQRGTLGLWGGRQIPISIDDQFADELIKGSGGES